MARFTFGVSARLTHDREFRAVYEGGVRRRSGPLSGSALPNGLVGWRLGLAIGRSLGAATRRTALKRSLREAFRHERPDLPTHAGAGGNPAGFDLVLSARPHAPLTHAEYRRHVRALGEALVAAWAARGGPA